MPTEQANKVITSLHKKQHNNNASPAKLKGKSLDVKGRENSGA